MKRTAKILTLVVLLTAGAVLAWWRLGVDRPSTETAVAHALKHSEAGYTCAMHPEVRTDAPGNCPICGMRLIPVKRETAAPADERRVLYWYDPMKPDVHFDAPGKSPFMDMDLVPKYADAVSEPGIVRIDPRMVQNLGMRTAPVERRSLQPGVTAVGVVQTDERLVQVVQARAAGWVEQLLVRAVDEPVRRGQPLVKVYAPELLTAQEEFLLALRAQDAPLITASRRRLRLLGVDAGQIARLEQRREVLATVTYSSPLDGFVAELNVREGQAVAPGMPMYRLVDLSRVWIIAEVPEAQAALVKQGATAVAEVASLPGERFEGRVDYVYPELSPATRTLRLRLVFPNPRLQLRPGLYADVRLQGLAPRESLMIPAAAVIRTGRRSTVILAEGEGRFRPVDVQLGLERDGQVEVLTGLSEGQEVVVSGQFLIDSEANLRSSLGRLAPDEGYEP